MPNFAEIAQKKVEDVEAPPLLPVGTYRFKITKIPSVSKSGDEAWEFLRIPVKVVEALDDVDLSDFKGDPTNVLMDKSFVFNTQDEAAFSQTEFQMVQFFEKHVGCVEADMTIPQMLNASVGGEFLGTVKWQQDKRDASGETMQATIGKTAPVS